MKKENKEGKRIFYIYGITDKDKIIYVGKTFVSVEGRYYSHINGLNESLVKGYFEYVQRPSGYIILQKKEMTNDEALELEKAWMIYLSTQGHPLLNIIGNLRHSNRKLSPTAYKVFIRRRYMGMAMDFLEKGQKVREFIEQAIEEKYNRIASNPHNLKRGIIIDKNNKKILSKFGIKDH